MCGLVGFVGKGDRAALSHMTEALVHRGPDEEGFYLDAEHGVHFGFRRLAILDLAGGHQPMQNADGSVCIVFNGEIYNHAELRSELESRGYQFRTHHSDTEVLIHGYSHWGDDLPTRLNGMFAFVVWDKVRRRVFGARDRFGEKPLYYLSQPGLFAFSSELSGIARHPAANCTLDQRAVQKFFAHGYFPAPNTIYREVRKLPAGCSFSFEIGSGEVRERRYWRFIIEAEEEALPERDEALAEELRALLDNAVRRRLISDVALGVFLSGGIDSSTILALATRHRASAALDTFTIGFTEPSFDESIYARDVAQAFGSRHHEQILDLDRARDFLPSVLGALDEPLGDASILPTYLLAKFARQHVTVALSGDGGDELFAGYDPFAALGPAGWYSRLIPMPVHLLLRRAAELIPRSISNMSFDFKVRRALAGASYPQRFWNPVWMAPAQPALMNCLFLEPLPMEELYSEAIEIWDRSPALNIVDRTLEFFTNLYLQDDILTKSDRASMMVSLESRAVFLDNDVVAFCQRLPHGYKFRRGKRKYLLKRAMSGLLSDSVLYRKKKGFGIPLARWLREVPAKPPLTPVAGMRMRSVDNAWKEFRSGRSSEHLFLWSWLSLQYAAHPNYVS